MQRIVGWIKRQSSAPRNRGEPGSIGGAAFQLVVAIYGGFFGAGLGILTLAALAIQGFRDMQELDALKMWPRRWTTFIIAGAVGWPHTLTMLVTAMLGGYAAPPSPPPACRLAAPPRRHRGQRADPDLFYKTYL